MHNSTLITSEFQHRLAKHRKHYGLNYSQLGLLIGLSRDTLYRIETFKGWHCSMASYVRILDFLNGNYAIPAAGCKKPAPLNSLLMTLASACRILENAPDIRQRMLHQCLAVMEEIRQQN